MQTCSALAVLLGLHSSKTTWIKAVGCPRAILSLVCCRLSPCVSTCRIVLPTTLLQPYQPSGLCGHRTSSMRVEHERRGLLFSLQCNDLILVFSGAVPILIHAKMWIGHTKGHACMSSVSCIEPQHSGSLRLATSAGCGSRTWEHPSFSISPPFLALSQLQK